MRRFIKLVLIIQLILITSVFAQEKKTVRTISVSGTAVTQIMPDIILWKIIITDTDKDIKIAKKKNDEKLKAIFALQECLNIEKNDLAIGHLSIRKEYDEYQKKAFKHFLVDRVINVRQRDIKRFDEFLDKLVASAEIDVSFSLEYSKIHEVRAETKLKALRIAKEKASAMAEVIGMKLGKALAIREESNWGEWGYLGRSNAVQTINHEDSGDSGIFSPEAIEVQMTIHAKFQIE